MSKSLMTSDSFRSWVLLMTQACFTRQLSAMQVNFVTIIVGDNPNYGYTVEAPAFEVTFRHAQRRYPSLRNATMQIVYTPGMIVCPDAAAMMPIVAAQADLVISKLPGFTILFSPGCSLEALALGDFAREWNVPFLSTIGSDAHLDNPQRYPTVLAFGTNEIMSRMRGVTMILARYHWRTLSLLCDALSDMPSLATYPAITCRSLLATLDNSRYTLHVQRFDSGGRQAELTFTDMLKKAAGQSRVMLFASDPAKIRKIMIVAHNLNMTNGDYVYLAPVTEKAIDEGAMTWEYFDGDDQVALLAMRSLIYVNNPDADWDRIQDVLDDIAVQSETVYNFTLTNDTRRNDLIVDSYEAVTFASIVLDEMLRESIPLNTTSFRQKCLNKTIHMPSRPVAIQANGLRVSDVIFIRLNSNTSNMEITWVYKPVIDQLNPVSVLSQIYGDGQDFPPDQPLCGFMNDRCPTGSLLGSWWEKTLVALLGAILIGLISLCLILRQHASGGKDWWALEATIYAC